MLLRLAFTILALHLSSAVVATPFATFDELEEILARWERAEEPAVHLSILEEIAALAEGGGAPEDAIVEALARGLRETSGEVRARAVELLAQEPRQLRALDILVGECKRVARDESKVREQLEVADYVAGLGTDELIASQVEAIEKIVTLSEATRALTEVIGTPDKKKENAKKRLLRDLDERIELAKERLELVAELKETMRSSALVRSALLENLSRIDDERSVEGLASLVSCCGLGASAEAAAGALLELGDKKAVTAVIGLLEDYEDLRDFQEKEAKRLGKQKPGKKPDGWAEEVWERKENTRIHEAVTRCRDQTALLDEWAASIANQLAAFAAAKGLDPVPRDALPVRKWTSWRRAAVKDLPVLPRHD